MANDWIDKLRKFLPATKPEDPFEESSGTIQRTSTATPVASPWDAWAQLLRAGTPIFMISVGTILAIFTELVGIWAILGYALITAAPIVYLLIRIEQRLVEVRDGLQRLPSSNPKAVSRSSSFNKYD